MIPMKQVTRRRVLRGALGGAAVTVGLPFLDCFLNTNGTALAGGTPLPPCFGTWYWGCGLNPGRWEPKTPGKITALGPEMKEISGFKDRMNVYSNTMAYLDGKPLQTHVTGPAAFLTGTVSNTGLAIRPSLDVLIGDVIGTKTRFRSLEVSCVGSPDNSMSRRSATVVNPAEVSPLALYTRVFGPDFTEPNAADFKPDPEVMVRQSVLTAVNDQSKDFVKTLGASDRARLDQYFTALRELEQKLALEVQKPAPLEACSRPAKPTDGPIGTVVDEAVSNHNLFAKILVHALACGQTRIVNVAFSQGLSLLRFAGEANTQHIYTHDEAVDEKLGYQPNATKFAAPVMTAFNTLLTDMDNIKEGDKTLLDRSVIFQFTDCGFAKIHTIDNFAMVTVGSAGGRLKTGLHIPFPKGDPATRVGLTLQQIMGVPISSWGTESNQTSKTITEIVNA